MLATMQRLDVATFFSRPSVSDDNSYFEELFRTLNYRPGYPKKPVADLEVARAWADGFVARDNGEHFHGGVRFVCPNVRHESRDRPILAPRHAV